MAWGGVAALAMAVVAFAVGPRVRVDEEWIEPDLPTDLDRYLTDAEAAVPDLREGDQREIVWRQEGAPGPTPISIVYLHGFSADRHEVEPVISQLAAVLDANIYFTRLTGHGRDGTAMAEASVSDWFGDVAEAIAIGGRIGDRVLLVGTSTGGTLAAWAATRAEARERVAGMVLISPNFHPKDRTSRVLLYPWGSAIARLIVGKERCFSAENEEQARHWTTCYPTSALPTMMGLVEHVRTMDLSGVTIPTLVLYSPDDLVVDAAETTRVLATMTGAEVTTHQVAAPTEPAHHVLAGDILSPASNQEVLGAITAFAAGILEMDDVPGGGRD